MCDEYAVLVRQNLCQVLDTVNGSDRRKNKNLTVTRLTVLDTSSMFPAFGQGLLATCFGLSLSKPTPPFIASSSSCEEMHPSGHSREGSTGIPDQRPSRLVLVRALLKPGPPRSSGSAYFNVSRCPAVIGCAVFVVADRAQFVSQQPRSAEVIAGGLNRHTTPPCHNCGPAGRRCNMYTDKKSLESVYPLSIVDPLPFLLVI